MAAQEAASRRLNGIQSSLAPGTAFPAYLPALQNCPEVTTPVELDIQGTLPSWLSGVLYRAGPGTYTIPLSPEAAKKTGKEAYQVEHWFDGFTQIHRFEITTDGKVVYRSRNTAEGAVALIKAEGDPVIAFGQTDPCVSLFGKFFSFFSTMKKATSRRVGDMPANARNVGVTVSPDFPIPQPPTGKIAGQPSTLVIKTDQNALQQIDPITLEPIKLYGYENLNPDVAQGPMSAAHGQIDFKTGERMNFVSFAKIL
jgi:torulene dioxygenase